MSVALVTLGLALAGCSGGAVAGSTAVDSKTVKLDAASLVPANIVGKGKYGEVPASVESLQLTDAEKEKVRAGKFKVGLVMQTMDIDWSTLNVKGIKTTLEDLGVEVIGVTDAKFKVETQIADIENMITKKPDLIISIPTDDVATAQAYKKVAVAGIKLVIIQQPPAGLKYPTDYQTVVSPDNQGNGEVAAAALSEYIPQNGVAGLVDYGADFFTTNQRSLRVKDWFKEHRPDVKVKTVTFTDTNGVGPVASNFVTANPDVNGLFLIWDSPAMQSIAALRNSGVTLPITTMDLGNEVAVDMASGGYIKAIGAQKPYDQGVAEAVAAANVLIGKTVPAWIALPAVAVTPGNLLSSYKDVFKTDPPQELVEACKKSGICG
jgi:ribose transport system substrate-binding protein